MRAPERRINGTFMAPRPSPTGTERGKSPGSINQHARRVTGALNTALNVDIDSGL
jgi:hypothetical protein